MKVVTREFVVIESNAVLFRSPFKKAAKAFQVASGRGSLGKLRVTEYVTSNDFGASESKKHAELTTP